MRDPFGLPALGDDDHIPDLDDHIRQDLTLQRRTLPPQQQDWYTTSGTVVFLPTEASSSSSASLASIGSVSVASIGATSVASIGSISAASIASISGASIASLASAGEGGAQATSNAEPGVALTSVFPVTSMSGSVVVTQAVTSVLPLSSEFPLSTGGSTTDSVFSALPESTPPPSPSPPSSPTTSFTDVPIPLTSGSSIYTSISSSPLSPAAPSSSVYLLTTTSGSSPYTTSITSAIPSAFSPSYTDVPVTLTSGSQVYTSGSSSALPNSAAASSSVYPLTSTSGSSTYMTSITSAIPSPPSPSFTNVPITVTSDSSTYTTTSLSALPLSSLFPLTTTSGSLTFTTSVTSADPPNSSYTLLPMLITSGTSIITSFTNSPLPSNTALPQAGQLGYHGPGTDPVCAGQGMDSAAWGIVASCVICGLVGMLLWLVFALLRPRLPQLYASRTWFPPAPQRSPPLSPSLFSFLFPPNIPFLPSLPSNPSPTDPTSFPPDDLLSQRTLVVALRIIAGWSLLGLAGCIPLYVVDTPCLGEDGEMSAWGGRLSSLTDLSVVRLLELMDANRAGAFQQFQQTLSGRSTSSESISKRALPSGTPSLQNVEIRLTILSAILLLLAVLPALYRLRKEFIKLVAFRQAFVRVRCEGIEMGWLGVGKATGLQGWGEGRVKALLGGLGLREEEGGGTQGTADRPVAREGQAQGREREAEREIDIHGVFTVVDTTNLRSLIDRRDKTLTALESAEAQYIFSFRLSTPTPSHSAYPSTGQPGGSTIDEKRVRHKPISTAGGEQQQQLRNPDSPPQNYLAPPSFYKIPGPSSTAPSPAPGEKDQSWDRRVVGTRFQELTHYSEELALGSRVRLGSSGELEPDSPESGAAGTTTGLGSVGGAGLAGPTGVLGPNDPGGQYGEDWDTEEEEDGVGRRGSRRLGRASSVVQRLRASWVSGHAPSESITEPLRGPGHRPATPAPAADSELSAVYARIKEARSELKALNMEIEEAQRAAFEEIARGEGVRGWVLVGRGLGFLEGVELIEGRSREDVRWEELQAPGGVVSNVAFWGVVMMVSIMLALALIPVAALALGDAPDFSHFFPFLNNLTTTSLGASLAITLAPAIIGTLFVVIALLIVNFAARFSGSASHFTSQFLAFKATFYVLTAIAGIWLIAVSAVLFGLEELSINVNRSGSISDGSIYIGVLIMAVVMNLACIAPALLLLKPIRMWKVLRAEHKATTPRQKFRAIYPPVYNPSYVTGFCLLAILFAATLSLLFPLIGPPIVLLLFLSIIAHRFLVGYVYGRTKPGQTGALLQIWIIRRFACLLALQPLLLGLLLLGRELWILGGILLGFGFLLVFLVEWYCGHKTRKPHMDSLSQTTQNALHQWHEAITTEQHRRTGEEGESLVSSRASHAQSTAARRRMPPRRGSIASLLDMMAVTLAVIPPARSEHPVPLPTEAIDDLVSTAQAARSHPDAPEAPPTLGPLSTHFEDPAEETAGLLYSPELLAPVPIVWLPDDGAAGVARAEAYDLQRYHGLVTILDVKTDNRRTHS